MQGRDAGVVDDDVDLEFSRFRVREVVLRCSDQVCGSGWVAEVGLHGQGFDRVCGFEARCELLGGLGRRVGGVVQDHRGSSRGEGFGDCCADACGGLDGLSIRGQRLDMIALRGEKEKITSRSPCDYGELPF